MFTFPCFAEPFEFIGWDLWNIVGDASLRYSMCCKIGLSLHLVILTWIQRQNSLPDNPLVLFGFSVFGSIVARPPEIKMTSVSWKADYPNIISLRPSKTNFGCGWFRFGTSFEWSLYTFSFMQPMVYWTLHSQLYKKVVHQINTLGLRKWYVGLALNIFHGARSGPWAKKGIWESCIHTYITHGTVRALTCLI